jgi:menaquinone-dependent protoporphyrinogen oxidase
LHSCLVAYATKNGSTYDVAARIANTLRLVGVAVTVERARDVGRVDQYDSVIVGAPIYHGRWHRDGRRFVRRFRSDLKSRRLAIFALGPRQSGQEAFDRSWLQMEHLLVRRPWLEPTRVEVFGGTDPPGRCPRRDVRDWSAIAGWCKNLAVALHLTDWDVPHRPGLA